MFRHLDCRITFGSRRWNRSGGRLGITLVELLVGIGIGSLVLLILASLSLYSGKSIAAMWNYVDLDQSSRMALDRMTKDIRQTVGLSSYTPHRLTFVEPDGVPLTYEYSPLNRSLTRTKGTDIKVLLTECDELSFAIYQRNPSNAVYDYFPTATATNCKLVNVSWTCSRRIFGSPVNTESVQTAKIVIRKK